MSQGPIDEPALSPGEREVERALAGLAPATAGMSREEMLFEAGRASGSAAAGRGRGSSHWVWKGACLVLAGVALWGVLRPAEVVERTVVVERAVEGTKDLTVAAAGPGGGGESAAPAAAARVFGGLPEGSYLQMRNAVLDHGMSAVKVERGGGGTAGASEGSQPVWRLQQNLGGAL
jgi:hypothetical protein